jgi:predicted transcriptional regulator YdeE
VRIETIAHEGMLAVGFRVDGTWQTLPRDMPAAWRELFARRGEIAEAATGLGGYAGISLEVIEGRFKEFVGIEVAACEVPPVGMVVLEVPPNTYLSCTHEGALGEIFVSFGTLAAEGAAQGLGLSEVKLDFGYDAEMSERPHRLYRAIEPAAMPVVLRQSREGE